MCETADVNYRNASIICFLAFVPCVAQLMLSNIVAMIHLLHLLRKQKGPTQGHKKETGDRGESREGKMQLGSDI